MPQQEHSTQKFLVLGSANLSYAIWCQELSCTDREYTPRACDGGNECEMLPQILLQSQRDSPLPRSHSTSMMPVLLYFK